jgi:OHCU decarboxylase
MTLDRLNAADREAFVDAIGFAYEDSPWIAEAAWQRRPFANLDALHASMVSIVKGEPAERQLALIAGHPDLAGHVAREGWLSGASAAEQAAAGLDQLTADELIHFDRLNGAYRARFDFPFVICAREHNKTSIIAALEERVKNDRETEIATALDEIAKVARLRLAGAVSA